MSSKATLEKLSLANRLGQAAHTFNYCAERFNKFGGEYNKTQFDESWSHLWSLIQEVEKLEKENEKRNQRSII